jgi:hypothetical protein
VTSTAGLVENTNCGTGFCTGTDFAWFCALSTASAASMRSSATVNGPLTNSAWNACR